MKYLIAIVLYLGASQSFGEVEDTCIATKLIDRLQILLDAYQNQKLPYNGALFSFVTPLNTVAYSLRSRDRGFYNPKAMLNSFDAIRALKEKFGKRFRGQPDWHAFRAKIRESFFDANKLYAALSTAKFNLEKYKEIEDGALKGEINAILTWIEASLQFISSYPGEQIKKVLDEDKGILDFAVGYYEKDADAARKEFLRQYIQERLTQDGALYLYRIGGTIGVKEVKDLARFFAYVRSPNFDY